MRQGACKKTVKLTGKRMACLLAQRSSSHSQRQLIVVQVARLTVTSGSIRPASTIGHISFINGVINSLQPSAQIPKASIAPLRLAGSGEVKYCTIKDCRGGNT